MRRPVASVAVGLAVGLLISVVVATPAFAVPYGIRLVRPTPVAPNTALVSGNVVVAIRAEGLGLPTAAGYQMTEIGTEWWEPARIAMSPDGPGRFRATVNTTTVPNGTYVFHARAWGGGPQAYDPKDSRSFAATAFAFAVSNPPPVPRAVKATGGKGTATVSWMPVASAGRSDFAGYGVYRATAAPSGCPDPSPNYVLVDTTFATSHQDRRLARGRYCYTVVAIRSSPVTGTVLSPASGADGARVRKGKGVPAGTDPSPTDGSYDQTLPYQTPSPPAGGVPGGLAASGPSEAGRDVHAPLAALAIGLILAVSALLLRRFLAVPRES